MTDRLPKSLQRVAAEIRALRAEIHLLRAGLDGAVARSRQAGAELRADRASAEAHRRRVSGLFPIPLEPIHDDDAH